MVSNSERVEETAAQLRQRYQADILALQADVTDEEQVRALYEQAAARFGTIDVSIQNAGVITIDYFDRMPKADFEKCWRSTLPASGSAAVKPQSIWLNRIRVACLTPLPVRGVRALFTLRITPPAKWA